MEGVMKKIKQLTFVLFIVSALAFSYPVTQVFAQGGGQCDSNPACNPASGTCCGQCDPSPACNPNDPNGIPCCSLEGNNNQHQDPMNHDMDDDDQDNDEINHDRRNNRRHKKNKRGRDRRGELREKLNECLDRERNSHQPPQRSTQHTPPPNCSGSVQQATSANQAINDICLEVAYVLTYSGSAVRSSRILTTPAGETVTNFNETVYARILHLVGICRDLGRITECDYTHISSADVMFGCALQ